MERERPNIIVADSFGDIDKKEIADYLGHAYCHEGECEITYNGNIYKVVAGDCVILPRCNMVTKAWHSEDCRMDVIYVTPEFIEVSTPQSNYGMKGTMALFHNPVMHLSPEHQKVCALDFDYIKRRLALTAHNFHRVPACRRWHSSVGWH